MERINAADNRVVALSKFLEKPQAAPEPLARAVAALEPRALLEQERLRVIEEATRTGYAEGIKRAEEEVRTAVEKAERCVEEAHAGELDRLRSATKQMQELLSSLPQAIADSDTRAEAAAAEVSFASVLRVLGEGAIEGSLIADICRQALIEYRQRPVIVRVAMSDVEAVAALVDVESVRVAGDPRLIAGECRLETHKGIYDSSLEVRLEGLKQAFLRSIRAEAAGA